MASRSGLGPLGRTAVSKAAQELSTSPVTDPNDVLVNPANIVVNEPLPENETMPTNWQDFDSSRIASAGYDAGSQRLYVLFHKPYPGGTTWTYHGIPPNVWKNLQRSASAGRFVNRVLNQYRYNPGRW
jgi:KTSC domain